VLDAEKRAKLCGEPATASRETEPGIDLAFCAAHAAAFDAKHPPTCALPVVPRCERWVDEQLTRACGEPATTTRRGAGEDVPLCAEHAADFDNVRAWAGAILGIAELTGENPADIAEIVGPPPGKKGGA
jgi:hypothetical protein